MTRKKTSSLDRLFRPRSVAVIGAVAPRRAASAVEVLQATSSSGGFSGKVFPVNPNAEVVHSIKCHKRVTAIPDPGRSRDHRRAEATRRRRAEGLRKKGRRRRRRHHCGLQGNRRGRCKGRSAELTEIARKAGMRLVGPNCMGILNGEDASTA